MDVSDRLNEGLDRIIEARPDPCPYCGGSVTQEGLRRLRCEACGAPVARTDVGLTWYDGRLPAGLALAIFLLLAPLVLPLVILRWIRDDLVERLRRGLLIKK